MCVYVQQQQQQREEVLTLCSVYIIDICLKAPSFSLSLSQLTQRRQGRAQSIGYALLPELAPWGTQAAPARLMSCWQRGGGSAAQIINNA